ncbi:helix-turn-helix domain-containing protein [Candidatus Enterococcus murrayae]|uniref:Helix-turn-helix domain-containing protein n=1 Tax=Candidatus Enterococcus murrayae TaxID=2815321 RepID=A0ABS3HGH4_9ENTE|nr:helix-turn-helix domain-containing protein [Enterococcus sp. MJM16]MBO0452539.1 helix-turn-helix domain-containing protein [Enterococcus sp. MJM16]
MNLRRLLKRDSQRQLQLIELLYYSPHPRSSEELMTTIQCTLPILLSDIRAINKQSDYYKINNENSLYSLELKDNATLDVFISTMLTNSMAFKILEVIFYEDCYSLIELSKRLFCSLSTAQAFMINLQTVLAGWKMTILRRPYRLAGNEVAIRHLFFLYFSEKKAERESTPFSSEFFQFGDEIIRSMIANNKLEVSLAQYNRLSLTFFISLVRNSNEHFIPIEMLKSTAVTSPSQQAIDNFDYYLMEELDLLYSEDVMKDSFWLLYSDLFLLGDEQIDRALQTNHSLAYHFETHFILAERLSKMLITPLSERKKEQLATILVNQHLFHAKTKEFISVLQDRKKECLYLLDTFHAHSVHQLRNLVIKFTDEYDLFKSSEFIDNYVYQIIAAVPSCLNGMKQLAKPVNLLIVSSDSKMQESLLSELLRLSIKGNYAIHQINVNQLHNQSYLEVFEEYDVVISTSTFDVPSCKTPIIAVELCPSMHSITKIQQLIDKIVLENNQFTAKLIEEGLE